MTSMTLSLLLQLPLALAPALILALIGKRWFRVPNSPPAAHLLRFLLSVHSILLGAILVLTRFQPPFLQAPALAFVPPLMGVFAILLLVIAHDPAQLLKFGPSEWVLLLIALGLLVTVVLLTYPDAAIRLLIASGVLAVSLRLRTARGGWVILSGCLALALVVWEICSILENRWYGGLPPWLADMLRFVWPLSSIAVCVAAGLIAAGLGTGRAPALTVAAFALSAAILLLSGVHISLLTIWDMAADSSQSFWAVLLISLLGVTAGVLLEWLLPDRGRAAALLFALVVPLGACLAVDGGYQAGPMRTTAQLATWVDQAIVRYHADHQRYPQALSELAPWYLIVVPQPMTISRLPWCYESGADYYRFGYSFMGSSDLTLAGSAGMTQAGSLICEPRP